MAQEMSTDPTMDTGPAENNSPQKINPPASPLKGRLILLAIIAVGVLPLLAALYFRYVSPPEVTEMVGRPLEPVPLPFELLRRADGAALDHPAVSGKWLMIIAAPGGCDERCRHTLYLTRQARTAQGRNMARLDRFWLITDASFPAPDLLAMHPDLVLIKPVNSSPLEVLGGGESRYVNLVDRRGMLVFRYTDNPEPKAFIRELGKLIKF